MYNLYSKGSMVLDIWVIRDIFLSWRAIGPNWKGKQFSTWWSDIQKMWLFQYHQQKIWDRDRHSNNLKESPSPCEFLCSTSFQERYFCLCHLLFHHTFLAKLHLAAYFFNKSIRMATLGQGWGLSTGKAGRGVALKQYQMHYALLWNMMEFNEEPFCA